MAAIFSRPESKVRANLGLPPEEPEPPSRLYCWKCGKKFQYQKSRPRLCWQCWRKDHHVLVACSQCGNLVDRCKGEVIRLIAEKEDCLFFCDKHCQGAWVGKHYGFGKEKENGKAL